MGDGTKGNPFTREDVHRLIEENGGTAKELDLSGKVFEKGINLSGINLKEAVLEECHLEGLQLSHAHFEGAFMSGAHLEDIRASGVHFENTELVGAHLERARLVAAHLEGAEFFDAHLEEATLVNTFLDRTRLSGTHLQGVYLFGAKFSANTKMESVDWGDYILGEEKKGETKGQGHHLKWAEEIYRRLKVWYTNAGYHDVAARFYYREKEATRKGAKRRQDRVAGWLSWAFFGHGERWRRILIWIAVVVFGLAAAYYFWGSFSSSSFWDTLYYSAASFSALGYGSWAPQPTGWAKGMGAAEAIIGVFMMALLLVTFVRKWTR